MRERLVTAGFRHIDDFGAGALNTRFFSGRTDALAVGPLGRIVRALV